MAESQRRKVIGCLALLAAIVTAAAQSYGTFGPLLDQSMGWPTDCLAVHAVHMPGGNVLLWGKRATDTRLYVRNSFTGLFLTETTPNQWTIPDADLFCAGQTILPDGKVLIVGGTVNTNDGINKTFLFDPVSLTWSSAGLLAEARYYPSVVTLLDGNAAVVSGWQTVDNWARKVEIRNAATGEWTFFTPANSEPGQLHPHYYPFLFTVYNADNPSVPKVFSAGKSLADNPSNMRTPILTVTSQTSGRWDQFANSFPVQGSGAVILIRTTEPLSQFPVVPRDKGIVYKFGGSDGSAGVSNAIMKIDLNEEGPDWAYEQVAMLHARADCNILVLPDGRIAIVGGSSEQRHYQQEGPGVNTVEIFDPNTLERLISPLMARPRMYHSIAILLPDGSVLIAGGQYRPDGSGQNHPGLSDFNGQIYYPGYMQAAARPTITGTFPLAMPYGPNGTFTVYTNEADTIQKVSLIRLSATTHDADMNARFINLSIKERTADSVTVWTPCHPSIAPPGDYMLFIVNTQGIPSVARYVRLQ